MWIGNRSVLIVDDEMDILEALKMFLENYYTQVFTATNGQQALQVLIKNPIDCVLSDINMPVMNGINFLKKMREMKLNIPFIFFTGYGNNELMLEAVKYGAFDFVSKPSLKNLESIIKKGIANNFSREKMTANQEELTPYQMLLKTKAS